MTDYASKFQERFSPLKTKNNKWKILFIILIIFALIIGITIPLVLYLR